METYVSRNTNDYVPRGARIGTVGDSGSPGSYHLHFEVNNQGTISGGESNTVEPQQFFPDIEFRGYTIGGYVPLSNLEPDSIEIQSSCQCDDECTEHIFQYHFIPVALIEYVGEMEYNNWKESLNFYEEFNIVNFINHFDITEQEFEYLELQMGTMDLYDANKMFENETNDAELMFLNSQPVIK